MRTRDLYYPPSKELADVIRDGLFNFYTDVDVTSVKCPNLTIKPFNLASPGLGGDNGAFVEVLNSSENTYDCTNIIKNLTIERNYKQYFIFGNGIYQRPRTNALSELVLNATFLPQPNGELEIKNQSCIITPQQDTCYPKMLTNSELKRTLKGSFFLCNGKKGTVLRVRVKRFLARTSDLVNSMQAILQNKFGSAGRNVVLGGVYKAWNLENSWQHELIPNLWENWTVDESSYCRINTPEIIISTFNSTNGQMSFSSRSSILLNGKFSSHSLSHHSSANLLNVFNMEFLGYFRPAKTLYVFDESDLTSLDN